MTIIDQRILIPANSEVIWGLLSNLADNPKWQVDCRSVSFLTAPREGTGMRWRTTHTNGSETVEEITAWYDGLGYEYTYVDGAPYKESKGRIRLQEIAEGTVVQWTFTYEMPGVIGGLRNTLGTKRQIEANMVESLKGLWRYINQTGGSQQFHEAKSLMRDALDYEQRAQYKPRHKLVGRDEPQQPVVQSVGPIIPEPPISDEDTKPRPSVAIPKNEPVESMPADPDFLFRPATLQPDSPQPSPEIVLPERETVETPAPVSEEENEEAVKYSSAELEPKLSTAEMRAILDTTDMDTGKVSIWEVFGVQPPSATQQMRAVKLAQEQAAAEEAALAEPDAVVEEQLPAIEYPQSAEPPKEVLLADQTHERPAVVVQEMPPAAVSISTQRTGLRVMQRRKLVKVRRVGK